MSRDEMGKKALVINEDQIKTVDVGEMNYEQREMFDEADAAPMPYPPPPPPWVPGYRQ
jgi:hypothetical protein